VSLPGSVRRTISSSAMPRTIGRIGLFRDLDGMRSPLRLPFRDKSLLRQSRTSLDRLRHVLA
jgi:hypothetical protein